MRGIATRGPVIALLLGLALALLSTTASAQSLDVQIRGDIQDNHRDLYSGGQQPVGLTMTIGPIPPNYVCQRHGVMAREVFLLQERHPDGITQVAYYCRQGNHYWVHLTGGFAGFDIWTGPFTLPSLSRLTTRVGTIVDYDPGYAIGGETDPAGWALVPQTRDGSGERIYLRGDKNFSWYEGLRVRVRGYLREDALSAGGVETPSRTFDVLYVRSIEILGDDGSLAGRIREDIQYQQRDIFAGGPNPDGLVATVRTPVTYVCREHGVATVEVFLLQERHPDGMTQVAYYCGRGNHYWVHVTGGFASRDIWTGPFLLLGHIRALTTEPAGAGQPGDAPRGIIDVLDGEGRNP